MNIPDFAIEIKNTRSEKGMTRKQLADYLGVTASCVKNYEAKLRRVPAEIWVKIEALRHSERRVS